MAAARKYEALTDGSEALIIQFVNKPSEEAALKAFNEVARQSALSSKELKNVAIDEIRKELQTLATKAELQATKEALQAEIAATKEVLQAEIKVALAKTEALIEASEKRQTKWFVGVLISIAFVIAKILFF